MANLATISNNILADSGIDPIDLIVGTGTVDYIAKFTAEGAIGNSIMSQSGSNILINGNITLHAGNYNNYAPTLTGGGASGTWGINITGKSEQVTINYGDNTNANFYMLFGSGNSLFATGLIYLNAFTDTIYAAAYRGSANVDGTGEASYHPAGIYSGGTEWFYGTMYRNGSATYHANGSLYQVGLLELNNGFQIGQVGGTNYAQFNSWVFLPSYHGFYSGQNGAHFSPNDGTYGAWKMQGTRNGYGGIEFVTGNGNLTLMISTDSNTVGFHNTAYGWQTLWQNGSFYVYKNSYGGGTQALVLDTSNYNSYAPTLTGGGASGTWGINITGSAGYASSAGNADTVDGYHASAFALVNGNTGQSFGVFELTYAQTQFNPSLGPRGGLNAMSIKMWDNYFAGIGLGDDYGTVMEYYGRGGHVDTQVYFDAGGGSWYRSAAYAAGWQSWQKYVTENSGTWSINISGASAYSPLLIASGSLLSQYGNGTIGYSYALTAGTSGLFSASDNSNAIITVNRHPGDYYSQLGFSSNGELYYRRFSAAAINTSLPWVTLLTSNNYNSYAPTLTGGGASGTWGINITGNAVTSNRVQKADESNLNTAFTNTPAGQLSWTESYNQTNAPTPNIYYNTISMRHGNSNNVYGNQLSIRWADSEPYTYVRVVNDNSFGAWRTILADFNYNSYAPTLTGGGASGTWGINVTGNAQYLANNVSNPGDANNIWRAGVYTYFNGTNVPGGDFGLISIPTWTSTDSSSRYNLQIGSNIGGDVRYRATNINGAGTWNTLLSNVNYNSYAPTLTGGGASGTWGISITGNADTVDGYHESAFMRYYGYSTSGNFQTFQAVTGTLRFDQVGEINSGSWSNAPTDIYPYGGVLSYRGSSFGFQIYASHVGGMVYKTQWNDDQYSGWQRILDTQNYTNYAVPTSGFTFGSTFAMGTMYVSTGEQNTPSYLLGVFSNGYAYKFSLAGIQSWIGLGSYLPLAGGTMTGQILGPSVNDGVYGGLIQIRERGYVGDTQSAWSYSPAITFHWGNRFAKRLGFDYDGYLAVDDVRYLNANNYSSYALPLSGGTMSGSIAMGGNNITNVSQLAHANGRIILSGNLHIDSFNGYAIYLQYYNQGVTTRIYGDIDMNNYNTTNVNIGYANNSFRAPIFYDSNDTNYYLDPNATSNLYKIRIGNGAEVPGLIGMGAGFLYGMGVSGAYTTVHAHPSANGVALGYFDGTTFTTRFYVNNDGNAYAVTGMYAPIFYDSQNTAYYLDPSNFSNLYSATFNSTVNLQTTNWFGGYGPGSGPGIGLENQGTFARFAFWGLDFYDWNHGRQMLIDGNYIYVDNYLQAGNSLRAPIFYDSNDTSYYLDPNSTSNLLNMRLLNGKWYMVDNNSGNSIDIYVRANADNTYVWRHIYGGSGTGYGTGPGGYGIYNQTLGGDYSAIFASSGYVTFPYSVRSPIFYDSANTNYYLDPNGASVLDSVTTIGRIYSNEWIQFSNYTGLYSPNNGAHFRPNSGTYGPWLVTGTRSGWSGIEFESLSNGNVSLMINTSSNQSGWHNNSYGWQFKWEGGTAYVFKNSYGGGTQATVIDSSNYTSYAMPYFVGAGSVDYNSNTTNGIYRNQGGANGPTSAHTTMFSAFQVDGNYGWQLSSGGSANIYFRYKSSVFEPWYRIYTNNDASASSTANTLALRDSVGDISAREFILTATFLHTSTPTALTGIYQTTNQVVRFGDTAVRNFLNVPTRTGGDASGTWGINVNGYSTYLSDNNASVSDGFVAWNSYDDTTNNPGNSWWYGMRVSHGDALSYYSFTISSSFFSNEVYYRRIQGGTAAPWIKFLDANNYNSYALPLTGGTMTGAIVSNATNQNFTNFTARNTSTGTSMPNHLYYYIEARYNSGSNGTNVYHWVRDTWEYNITNNYHDITLGATYSGSSYVNLFRVSADGNIYATNSFRAPIFYDSADTTYYVDPNGGSYLRGRINVTGGHYNSSLRVFLRADENGAGTGEATLQMWVSEPNVSWAGAGFGYNVTNDGGGAYSFNRINSSFGQAYMRFTDGGDLYFYNANTSGTRVQTALLQNNGTANFYYSVYAPAYYESSDMRIKELIEDNYKADGIESITARLYKKNGKIEVGYYAQDVQDILPSAVSVKEDGYLNLSYREVHTAKIAYLENKIKQLEEKLNSLY